MSLSASASPAPARPGACVLGAALEPLAGTAPHRCVWALIEHPGPWGREALTDAPWPPGLGRRLQSLLDDAGVRAVLARRHRSRDADPVDAGLEDPRRRPRVILCVTGPGGWAGSRRLDSPHDLLDLDWMTLVGATSRPHSWLDPGGSGGIWAICTHGTRDACCAVLGRPLAAAFAAVDPHGTWEISHSGGHRFSGVVLALPEGLCYGRVGPGDVAEIVEARRRGDVVPRLLRGRMHLQPALQSAELALLAHLGTQRLDAVAPLSHADVPGTGNDVVRSMWVEKVAAGNRRTWQVDVTQVRLPDRPASCGKAPEPATSWRAATPVRVAIP